MSDCVSRAGGGEIHVDEQAIDAIVNAADVCEACLLTVAECECEAEVDIK